MAFQTGGSYTIIARIEMEDGVPFIHIANAIHKTGGEIAALDIVNRGNGTTVRDITVSVSRMENEKAVIEELSMIKGLQLVNVSDQTFLLHLGGKLEVQSKVPIKNRDDLSRVYTPGVARVCMAIHDDPAKAYSLTIKRNTIAVVTDGSAVLGLGNIGPEAAMPVMEGKAMLFKQLAGVDAFPVCLNTQDSDEIVRIVRALAPTFGGINLEDISSPRCFEIERRLIEELDIPVFHDDQHGTAVVILAGLINAVKLVGKRLSDCKVVVCGIGAAGVACTKMLLTAGVKNIIGVDREGAIFRGNRYHSTWEDYANCTNPNAECGALSDVIAGADIFIGLSGPNVLKTSDVQRMAKDAIVFAMANPSPEILPEDAEPYVRVMATGRSDYPNQINNVLCFPGMFRGVLDCRASRITEGMKLAAAQAIASVVREEELSEYYVIPSVFNQSVVEKVRDAVAAAAYESGVTRRKV